MILVLYYNQGNKVTEFKKGSEFMTEVAKRNNVSRGDIIWVDFKDYYGNVQGGIRPALVLQNNKGNHYSPTVILCTLTTKNKKLSQPTHILASKEETGLPQDSIIQLENIQTVNKFQIIKFAGKLKDEILQQVNNAIKVSLSLP